MRNSFVIAFFGAAVFGALAIAACVADDPGAAPVVPQGELGGACFTNGVCKEGLACGIVDGQAKCTTGSADGGTTPPGTPPTVPGTPPGPDTDGGQKCSYQTTAYPCSTDPHQDSCYGSTPDCSLTGCDHLTWECNSRRQCGNTACCLSPDAGTFIPGNGCKAGALVIADNGTAAQGTKCPHTAACADGEIQLCQVDEDCPSGKHCAAVIVTADAYPSLTSTTLAVCVTP